MPNRLRIISALETLLMELRETSVEGYSAALKISHRDLMEALLTHTKRLEHIEQELDMLRKLLTHPRVMTPPPLMTPPPE